MPCTRRALSFLALGVAVCTSLACENVGLGAPGTGDPLPAGGVPASQTLEGGAQVRLSPAGLTKLTSIVPSALHDPASADVCVPAFGIGGTDACFTNQAACTQACRVDLDVAPTGIAVTVTAAQVVHLAITASLAASVPIDPALFSPCTLTYSIDQIVADADVALAIDPATGVFAASLDALNVLTSGVADSGCPAVVGAERDTILTTLLDTFLATWIEERLHQPIDDLLGVLMPAPQALRSA
jgi:hypothetical protein